MWWKGGEAQENASVLMDWNMKLPVWWMSSIVDVLEQGTFSVVVYVCALRIREVISPLREEGSHVPDRDASMDTQLVGGCNCTFCMCRICCNGLDHYRWLVGIAYREICYHV